MEKSNAPELHDRALVLVAKEDIPFIRLVRDAEAALPGIGKDNIFAMMAVLGTVGGGAGYMLGDSPQAAVAGALAPFGFGRLMAKPAVQRWLRADAQNASRLAEFFANKQEALGALRTGSLGALVSQVD